MTLPDDPIARYIAIADTFTRLVAGTDDWDSPAPVAGWTARDVVWHLVDWIPNLLGVGAAINLPLRYTAVPDPAADWARFNEAMQAVIWVHMVPPSMARKPSWARSLRRSGTSALIPPI